MQNYIPPNVGAPPLAAARRPIALGAVGYKKRADRLKPFWGILFVLDGYYPGLYRALPALILRSGSPGWNVA